MEREPRGIVIQLPQHFTHSPPSASPATPRPPPPHLGTGGQLRLKTKESQADGNLVRRIRRISTQEGWRLGAPLDDGIHV